MQPAFKAGKSRDMDSPLELLKESYFDFSPLKAIDNLWLSDCEMDDLL